jgi:translation elongation factor EF-1beta/ubiquinone/menaquinone biosynthesis C-methylase UbiE
MAESSAAESVAKELQLLGDPSGRHDSEYWDQWFDAVCRRQDHRSFEWYCSAGEVLRVVTNHLVFSTIADETHSMIHPGSGTSLVPVKLRDSFPDSRQVVVDISSVALRQVRDQHASSCDVTNPIEYVVADLLHSSSGGDDNQIAFQSSTFDCWIDKGFVDAVFSKDKAEGSRVQSNSLFHEACRILKPGVGFALIISLAEDHSLRIIVENWLSSDGGWQPTLHIWELDPISGELPPFAFVLSKVDDADYVKSEKRLRLMGHQLNTGDIQEQSLCHDTACSVIQEYIASSRQRFSAARPKEDSHTTVRKVLATLEVKPCDAEVDLVALGHRIRSEVWAVDNGGERRNVRPMWQPFSDGDSSELYSIVPIGFGISKLLLKCVLPSDDLDDLAALIAEWDEGLVQSVDIDWQNTIPVGDVSGLLQRGSK